MQQLAYQPSRLYRGNTRGGRGICLRTQVHLPMGGRLRRRQSAVEGSSRTGTQNPVRERDSARIASDIMPLPVLACEFGGGEPAAASPPTCPTWMRSPSTRLLASNGSSDSVSS